MTALEIFRKEVALIEAERGCPYHDAWLLAKAMAPHLYAATERAAMANADDEVKNPVVEAINGGKFLRTFLPLSIQQILRMTADTTDGFILQRLRTNSVKMKVDEAQTAINGLISALRERGVDGEEAIDLVNRMAYPFFRTARVNNPMWEPSGK